MTYGQNQTLINETFTEDYNMRPNALSPQRGIHAGPLREGIKSWFSLKNVMYKDVNVTRMYTVEIGDLVLVVANFSGSMNHIPPGLPGYPQYPGIPEHKLRNKHFSTLVMGLHAMDQDKIRRHWHFADYQLALEQIPQSIYTWYDHLLSSSQENHHRDDSLFEQTFTPDVEIRPMEGDHLDIVEGRGPGLEKLKDLTRK